MVLEGHFRSGMSRGANFLYLTDGSFNLILIIEDQSVRPFSERGRHNSEYVHRHGRGAIL